VNYFNFVLLAGTAGMSLATVIRSEFSYPGVGILAGDSLQYLSIATAHGVIMVFYMIMPLIFGAFGNFLLPTQLGVHDVAFPRLNSAAFWFLPGGLIMLMQLVCVDRRYQRMNCFNIRELQGILKRRFFTDIVNSSDHRSILSSSMIGLRYKLNSSLNLDSDILLFHKTSTTTSPKSRVLDFHSNYAGPNFPTLNSSSMNVTNHTISNINSTSCINSLAGLSVFLQLSVGSLFSLFKVSIISAVQSLFSANFYHYLLPTLGLNFRPILLFTRNNTNVNATKHDPSPSTIFLGKNSPTVGSDINFYNNSEKDNLSRFSRFTNPILSYDYKCGHYIGIWDKLFPSLMTSFIEIARGIKKAPWFTSEQYSELLIANYKSYFSKFTDRINLKLQDVDN
jgi:hypothetical protein